MSCGLVMVHCPKAGSSWYAWILTWEVAVSHIYVHFLPLPGSYLFMFMHYLLEMLLGNFFSFVKRVTYRENSLLIKAEDLDSGFAFPLS